MRKIFYVKAIENGEWKFIQFFTHKIKKYNFF